MKPILATLLIFISHLLIGQNIITVSGKVLDAEENTPLSCVHIGMKGQSIGTISNSNGEFDFHISSDLISDTLIASHLGYDLYRNAISLIVKD